MIRAASYAALATALIGALALSWAKAQTIKALRAENTNMALALDAAQARVKNLMEDRASDRQVDQMRDDDLRDVPDHWLRQAPGAGGID